jgi:hypothetical protein
MNRRELLAAGFLRLARGFPGWAAGRSLSLASGREAPLRREAMSFPRKSSAPANPAPKPIKED